MNGMMPFSDTTFIAVPNASAALSRTAASAKLRKQKLVSRD
jgi:hypothetical protein